MFDTSKQRADILAKLASLQAPANSKPESWLQPQALKPLSLDDLCDHFCRVLGAHNSFIKPIIELAELPAMVADHLKQLSLKLTVHGGENSPLSQLAWDRVGISWHTASFTEDGQVAIATAHFGIADTGTLVMIGTSENPTRNNYLSEHHLVVLERDKIVAYSEDVWDKIRATNQSLPRVVNFISGPSSSADVGLKLEYGAHGPRSLAVFIIG